MKPIREKRIIDLLESEWFIEERLSYYDHVLHMWIIIKYCVSKRGDFRFRLWSKGSFSKFVTMTSSCDIDLSKPLFEYSEEQYKYLYLFLEWLTI